MKRKKNGILKNVPLSRKMLIIYISCVIIPIITLSIFYYHISVTGIQKSQRKDLESAVVKSENGAQAVMDRLMLVREMLIHDDEICDILSIDDTDEHSLIKASAALDSKAQTHITNEIFDSMIIYSQNPNLYSSTVHRKFSELEKTGWLKKYKVDRSHMALFLNYDRCTEKTSIVLLSMIGETPASRKNILRIDMPVSFLARELAKNAIKDSIYLLDEHNKVIAVGAADSGKTEYAEGSVIDISLPDVIVKEMDYPKDYKVVARYLPNNSEYVFEAQTIQFIVVVFLILFISSIIIYMVTKSLTDKMNVLTDCTVKIQHGVFETVDESDAGNDEIGLLYRGINDAVRKINSLINEVYAQKLKNAEIDKSRYQAELSALQARVNPHFMFNVFEVMRMKVIKRGDRELASVIKEISKIFRMLITWKSDIITLDEEMRFVNAFLNIQPYSIDDEEIDIRVSIDDAARECLVPKMSVQVFVENAFLHGLENISENRRFSLDAHIEDERLVITITDNGEGIDGDTLARIKNGTYESEKSGGTGIKNVLSRLKYYFDDCYDFEIMSIPYTETKVKLVLPVKYE